MSGSISLFADSYESDDQVLLCTLGRGQHVGELSQFFANRQVGMREVECAVTAAVMKQEHMDGNSQKGRKKKRKDVNLAITTNVSKPHLQQHALVPIGTPPSPLTPIVTSATSDGNLKARSYGITAVTSGCTIVAKLSQFHALQLLSSRCGWAPTSLRVFNFLRTVNIFSRLNFTRLLQLAYATRLLSFGAHEVLECQGERPAMQGGGGIWLILTGEAECMREIGVGPNAITIAATSKSSSSTDELSEQAKHSAINDPATHSAKTSESFLDSLATQQANAHLRPIVLHTLHPGDYFGEHCLLTSNSDVNDARGNGVHDPQTSFTTIVSTNKMEVLFISQYVLSMICSKQMLKHLKSTYAERLKFNHARVQQLLLNAFPPSARVFELKHSVKLRSQLLRSLPMFATIGSTSAVSGGPSTHSAVPGASPGGPYAFSNIHSILPQEDVENVLNTLISNDVSAAAAVAATSINTLTHPASAISVAASGLAPAFVKTTASSFAAQLSKLFTPEGHLRVDKLFAVQPAQMKGNNGTTPTDPHLKEAEADLHSIALTGSEMASHQETVRSLLHMYESLGPLDRIDPVLAAPSMHDVVEGESIGGVPLNSDEWRPRDKIPKSMFMLAHRTDISHAWGGRKKWLFAFSCIRKRLTAARLMGSHVNPSTLLDKTTATTPAIAPLVPSSPVQQSSPVEHGSFAKGSPHRGRIASAGSHRPSITSGGTKLELHPSPKQQSMAHGVISPRPLSALALDPAMTSYDSSGASAVSADSAGVPTEQTSPALHGHSRAVIANSGAQRAQERAKDRLKEYSDLKAAHFRTAANSKQDSFLRTVVLPTPVIAPAPSPSPPIGRVRLARNPPTLDRSIPSSSPPLSLTIQGVGHVSDVKDSNNSPSPTLSKEEHTASVLRRILQPRIPDEIVAEAVDAVDVIKEVSSSSSEDEASEEKEISTASSSFFLTALQGGDSTAAAVQSPPTLLQAMIPGQRKSTKDNGWLKHAVSELTNATEQSRALLAGSPAALSNAALPWSTAPASVGRSSQSNALTVYTNPTDNSANIVPGTRDILLVPASPSDAVSLEVKPAQGTAPKTMVSSVRRHRTRARNRLQNRDKHGRPLGGVAHEDLWSRLAQQGAGDVLSTIPQHLRDLKNRSRFHSPREQQLLSGVLSAGKSVFRLTAAAAQETIHAAKAGQKVGGGPIISSATLHASSIHSRPSDDAEFMHRQQLMLGGRMEGTPSGLIGGGGPAGPTNKAGEIVAAMGASPSEVVAACEKAVVEGMSAMKTFAHVWLGKALPYTKDADGNVSAGTAHKPRRIIIHRDDMDDEPGLPLHHDTSKHFPANKSAALQYTVEVQPTEYRYVALSAGFNPLSSPQVPNSTSTAASEEIGKEDESLGPVPSASGGTMGSFGAGRLSPTQRANQKDRRFRSRSPIRDLYATEGMAASAAAVAASHTQNSLHSIVNPLHAPNGTAMGAASMDVNLDDLRAREHAFQQDRILRGNTGPEKMEEKEQDYIPASFNWAVDQRPVLHLEGIEPTGAVHVVPTYVEPPVSTITTNPLSPLPHATTSAIDASDQRTSVSFETPTKVGYGPIGLVPSPPASVPVRFWERTPERTVSSQQHRRQASLMPGSADTGTTKNFNARNTAVAVKPTTAVAEKTQTLSTNAKDDDGPRFKTIELHSAVATSRAFRIKALSGKLALRADLGVTFQHLFRRCFGFHAELERVFVSSLTGFVYVQYAPGRLPASHVEEVVHAALVSEGHINADVKGISTSMMKDETFRCLYNLSEKGAPRTNRVMSISNASGVQIVQQKQWQGEKESEESVKADVPMLLRSDSNIHSPAPKVVGSEESHLLHSPMMFHARSAAHTSGLHRDASSAKESPRTPHSTSRNLQDQLHTSMPIMSNRSSLIDSLASQLLAAPRSKELFGSTDPQLFPVRDVREYQASKNQSHTKAWVSPFVAATSSVVPSLLSGMQRVQPVRSSVPVSVDAVSPTVVLKAPRGGSKSASRLRRESPAQILGHGSMGGQSQYQQVASLLQSVADASNHTLSTESTSGLAEPFSPPSPPYTRPVSRSIVSQVDLPLDTPVMYAPLSSRLPARPASSYGAVPERSPRTQRIRPGSSGAMHSAASAGSTPIGSHSARIYAHWDDREHSSVSVPTSALRRRTTDGIPVKATTFEFA
jgi:CRP-like cAMP-binding protein